MPTLTPIGAVRVEGLREFQKAVRTINAKVNRELLAELRRAAEPVAEEIRRRVAEKFDGANIQTIRPRTSYGVVYVTQRAPKKTGLRADFGEAQMEHAFIPGAEEKASGVADDVEEALGRFLARYQL